VQPPHIPIAAASSAAVGAAKVKGELTLVPMDMLSAGTRDRTHRSVRLSSMRRFATEGFLGLVGIGRLESPKPAATRTLGDTPT